MGRIACLLLLTLALGLAGCGGGGTGHVDCPQLLSDGEYGEVLDECAGPYERAAAHLGLAGFYLLDLTDADADEPFIVQALGLTLENIDAKRLRVNLAVNEVRDAANGSEAFALLVSAFLGLSVTTTQYLDNGAGATALDEDYEDSEIEAATGMSATAGVFAAAVAATPPTAASDFAVLVDDVPYIANCSADATASPNQCAGATILDDPDGSGILDGNTPAAPAPDLSTATRANLVAQVTNLLMPITLVEDKVATMREFLGQGDPTGTFEIGILGYLDLMDRANDIVAGEGETTVISEHVDSVRNQLDNGGDCLDTLTGSSAASDLLNALAPMYTTAAGTLANPVPDDAAADYYKDVNYSTDATLTALMQLTTGVASLDAADYVFPTTELGFRFVFPISQPLGGYDMTQATPRVDQADSTFALHFEAIPELAPSESTALDGYVTYLELLCSGD